MKDPIEPFLNNNKKNTKRMPREEKKKLHALKMKEMKSQSFTF